MGGPKFGLATVHPTNGYGFIQPDSGGNDVFVHISAVEKAGFTTLAEGGKVSFDIVKNRGKDSAENLPNRVMRPALCVAA
ncbi:cold-shock protein [Bradyrhizobium sp. CCBAU 65884]|uniref:cold-shock protein n=1 Tax=Bradyrhizobium sp. CCBAU 65884 TaxID=722477 RepID=UPI0023068052|nr:cold-shock protein [Bradyrhizobium sp. CCBAU 65884]